MGTELYERRQVRLGRQAAPGRPPTAVGHSLGVEGVDRSSYSAMVADVSYSVPRFCRIRTGTVSDEEPFPLDDDGFLSIYTASAWILQDRSSGGLISPQSAAESGAFVLLGEPGVGKTTVLQSLVTGLPEFGEVPAGQPCVLWLDGTELTDERFEKVLGRHLAALPVRQVSGGSTVQADSRGTTDGLTIVLDQLDESPIRAQLVRELTKALRNRETSGVRWLVACRAADYPPRLAAVFEVDGRKCTIADLAPLTRDQAAALATSRGVDGDALIMAAVSAGAGALASIPLTLKSLVRLYQSGSSLAGGVANLFRSSIQLLLEEHADGRGRPLDATIEQRFAIASRIAARLILSGKRTIWTGRQLGGHESEITAGSLVGGTESNISGPFEVGHELVESTIDTALFARRGADHAAFSHSSMAAYLAASYLVALDVPERQLRSLFLVASDGGHTSIPASLRETAAWLLTLDPSHCSWLAQADPQSLAAHSNLVDNATTRQALVAGLLRQAADVELGDLPWVLYRTHLSHPGLAAQLEECLTLVDGGPPVRWADRARVRLAVRLAEQAMASPKLVDPLLVMAESTQWDVHERRLAVDAVALLDSAGAGPRLRHLLYGLARGDAAVVDPDDQLHGALLQALWPGQLSLDEVLGLLRPRANPSFGGSYMHFLMTLPARVNDADLPRLLEWAARTMAAPPGSAEAAVNAANSDEVTAVFTPASRTGSHGTMPEELFDPLLDRATAWRYGNAYCDAVARLVWPLLREYRGVSLPEPLDVVGQNGNEPSSARDGRRGLCLALCRLASVSGPERADAWLIAHSWHRRLRFGSQPSGEQDGYLPGQRSALVSAEDFDWALQEAQAAWQVDPLLADTLSQVAAMIFNPDDRVSYELAFRYEGTPVWEHLKPVFDPIQIDSPLAEMLRAGYERQNPPEQGPWDGMADLLVNLRADLDQAVAGSTGAFWRLIWNMQFDPRTGKGMSLNPGDNPRTLPAASFLEPVLSNRLPDAALTYLASEHDHRQEWLGTGKYDKRARAGYQALVLLDHLKRVDELQDATWGSWAGAIVHFWPESGDGEGRDCKRRLVALASLHAPAQFRQALHDYVLGELAQGSSPAGLDLDDPSLIRFHAGALNTLVAEIASALQPTVPPTVVTAPAEQPPIGSTCSDHAAPLPLRIPDTEEARSVAATTLANVLRTLLTADDRTAVAQAVAAVSSVSEAGASIRAVNSAAALLHCDAARFWPTVMPAVYADPEFGLAVAYGTAAGYRQAQVAASLDEAQVGELYRWLNGLLPPAEDPHYQGVHDFSPDDSAREWRNSVLRELVQRQTPQAVAELDQLHAELPHRVDIAAAVVAGRAGLHAALWRPPTPAEVATLLADAQRRLVRDAPELAELLLQTFASIAEDLPAHGELLWDRQVVRSRRKATGTPAASEASDPDTWRPKPEAALSAYIAHELQLRLTGRGIAVNREVLIKPTNAYGSGDRTDILVEAIVHDTPRSAPPAVEKVVVVVELKGQWNRHLESDVKTQLAERYLSEAKTQVGIYLIGWYPTDQWNSADDSRLTAARTRTKSGVQAGLAETIIQIRNKSCVSIYPYILDVPRPYKEDRSGASSTK